MLANYFAIAYRNLLKNKFYSAINILGLAFGLTCVFLIVQYLRNELSYDRFHEGANDIYRITWFDENPQTRTPHPMAQALVADMPEVESAVSITPLWGAGLTRETFPFRNLEKDIRYDESNGLAVDTTFFDVFTFPLVHGDPHKVLKNTGSLVISESMAKKYFGDENPMGKQLSVNDELIEVSGVFKDVPANSHFHFDFLVSYVREKQLEGEGSEFYTWKDFGHYNYIRLKPGSDPKALEAKLLPWLRRYLDVSDELYQGIVARGFGFRLQPITDIHLHSHIRWELEANGYVSYIYMMTIAALLIFIIATVNFINLTSAQSTGRLKEIGVRKSLGAVRNQLAAQFTGESLLVSLLALVVSAMIIEAVSPAFRSITGNALTSDYLFFVLTLGGMSVIAGLTAGFFPSLYLSAAKPVEILRGQLAINPKGKGFREGFTLFQFFASMTLISCSIIIYTQLSFIQNKALGFDQDSIIVIPVKEGDRINPRIEELRTELMKVNGVQSVTASSNIPGKSFNQNPVFATENPQQRLASSEAMVDTEFFTTLNLPIVEGRAFTKANPADRDGFVINETAARNLFPNGAIGQELSWDFDAGMVKGPIIGVVKDFNFQSLHEPVRPLLFRLLPYYNYVLIRTDPGRWTSIAPQVESVWRKFDDRFTFDHFALSDELKHQYVSEQNLAGVLGAFAVIAVVVACLGLLGIAAITFRQKTKEVSVRKVLGASLPQLMMLLLRDFTRIVVIAIVLAVPLVWWMMRTWLEHFTYRVGINALTFVGSGLLLLVVAWATLSYLTIRVAGVNPAETLKRE